MIVFKNVCKKYGTGTQAVKNANFKIEKGKKVIAVPRFKQYKEHVNDHQKEITKSFNDLGYIIGLNGVEELEEAIKNIDKFEPKQYVKNTGKILQIVSDFIDKN